MPKTERSDCIDIKSTVSTQNAHRSNFRKSKSRAFIKTRLFSILLVFLLLSTAVSAAESESSMWKTQYASCQKEVKGSVWSDTIFTVNLEVWFKYNGNTAHVDHGLSGYYKLISNNVEVSNWEVNTQDLKDGRCIVTCSGVFRWTDNNPVFVVTNSAATSKVFIELRCDKYGNIGETKIML